MTLNISQRMRQAMFAQDTDEIVLTFLRLSREEWADDLRLVNNGENVVSQGEEYTAFPFVVTLPEDSSDAHPVISVTADNVSRELVQEIRKQTTPIEAVVYFALFDTPDTLEIELAGEITSLRYTADVIETTISIEPTLERALIGKIMNPENTPGIY